VSETGTKAEQLVNALELAIASRMDAEDDRDESEGEECLNRAIRAELTARTALLAYISELEADRERIQERALCEQGKVIWRHGDVVRFTVDPDCPDCLQAHAIYDDDDTQPTANTNAE
jgi:hypothetical protein